MILRWFRLFNLASGAERVVELCWYISTASQYNMLSMDIATEALRRTGKTLDVHKINS